MEQSDFYRFDLNPSTTKTTARKARKFFFSREEPQAPCSNFQIATRRRSPRSCDQLVSREKSWNFTKPINKKEKRRNKRSLCRKNARFCRVNGQGGRYNNHVGFVTDAIWLNQKMAWPMKFQVRPRAPVTRERPRALRIPPMRQKLKTIEPRFGLLRRNLNSNEAKLSEK